MQNKFVSCLCLQSHAFSINSQTFLRRISRWLLMAGCISALSLFAYSSTVQVGTCIASLPSYPTISQAVSSVPAGSTIKICPKANGYAEQVVITKNLALEGVSGNGLIGSGASGTNNPAIVAPAGGAAVNTADLNGAFPTAAQILVMSPTNATAPIVVNISNLIVDGSNNQLSGCGTDLVGIYYQNASGTIDHVTARFQELDQADFGCQDGLAIYAQSGYASTLAATVVIESSNVHDYDKNGITVDGNEITATVSGNYVVGIGATPLIAQNGIQVSRGAGGKVESNIVTDDVYTNPPDCQASDDCYSASGILLYDSGGTSAAPMTVSGNTVTNTQGAIVLYGDTGGTADYNTVSSNRITTSPGIEGAYFIDGIDMCGNHNSATANIIMNSSGSGVHFDSTCTESTGTTGNNNAAANNTVNEACAGVLTGNGSGNTVSGNVTYNVIETSFAGDVCPTANFPGAKKTASIRLKPSPKR